MLMWIVRDEDGLIWFEDKPFRMASSKIYVSCEGKVGDLYPTLFKNLTCDDEPLWIRFIPDEWILKIWK